jgi:hypothetical protein
MLDNEIKLSLNKLSTSYTAQKKKKLHISIYYKHFLKTPN